MYFTLIHRADTNATAIQPTELRLDADYQYYYINWIRTTLTAILPFILLTFLNGRIIFEIRKAEKLTEQSLHRVVRVFSKERIGREKWPCAILYKRNFMAGFHKA